MSLVDLKKLPSPPYPEEIDLNGLKRVQLPASVMLRRDLVLGFQDSTFGALLRLTVCSLQEVPAGSLPGDDTELRELAGMLNSTDAEWQRVRGMMFASWIRCTDGRYYDFSLIDPVMSMWRQLQGARIGGRRSVEARQQKRDAANAA